MTLDYYWDDLCGQKFVIRFKNCQKSVINMPKCSVDFSESEMIAYTNSWYTITNCTIENTDDLFTVKIKTIDVQSAVVKCCLSGNMARER